MLSIKQCRKILGEEYSQLSDIQIAVIRDFLVRLAKMDINKLKDYEEGGNNDKSKYRRAS